jgi:hypothetical protein
MPLGRKRRWLDGKRQHLSWEGWVLPSIRSGLLLVAFFMTWKGVSDFITAREFLADDAPFPIGDFSISRSSQVLIGAGFVVGMLILTMYVALRKWIAPIAFWKRALAAVLYVLVVLFSVGFGYGFWWGLFASKDVSDSEARAASAQLRIETGTISTRLAGVQRTIQSVADTTRRRSNTEAREGKTCGDDSGPTRGKRAKFREDQAEGLENAAKEVTTDIERIKGLLSGIDTPLSDYLQKRTSKTGKEELTRLDFELQQSARTLNQELSQVGGKIVRRVEPVYFAFNRKRGEPNFICNDEGLASELDAAIKEAKQPIQIAVPRLAYKEGADATASAVERLWQTVGGVAEHGWRVATLQMPWDSPLSFPLFGADAGGGRNIAAFVAAVGIDFSLLIFVLLDSKAPLDRFENVVPAAAGNLDKLLFLLETFIRQGDDDAIRFWRRCLLRVGSRAFFVAPYPDIAPPDKRSYLEAVEVLASVFSEVNGMGLASRLRFRSAWKRGVQRLEAWGWTAPTTSHFDLYLLNDGEFRELATRLEQHKIVEARPTSEPSADGLGAAISQPSTPRQPEGPGFSLVVHNLVQRARENVAARLRPSSPLAPAPPVESKAAERTLVAILGEVGATAASAGDRSPEVEAATPPAGEIADTSPLAGATGEYAVGTAGPQPSIGAASGDEVPDHSGTAGAERTVISANDAIEHLHDLEVAIKTMESQNNPALTEGLAAIRRKFQTSLDKNGIETFGEVGEMPHHDAHFIMGKKESALPAGAVAEILRSGYRRNGRVLHPADVLISDGAGESV